jgi:hypothetical protein
MDSARALDLSRIIGQTRSLRPSAGYRIGHSLSFLTIVHCFYCALFRQPAKKRPDSVISLSVARDATPGERELCGGSRNHTPDDTVDKFDYRRMAQLVEGTYAAVLAVADEIEASVPVFE